MRFFIADTHFFNSVFLGENDFAPRDFPDVATMHEAIVKNWNAVVSPNDTVYHLGDIADHPLYEKGYAEVMQLLLRLNGHLVFIKGNHDNRSELNYLAAHDVEQKFSFHDVGLILKFNHHQFFLTHYPLMLGITKNSVNLHGHVHNYQLPVAENINVGVDAPERQFITPALPFGTPINENQLLDILAGKSAQLEKLKRR